MEVVRPDANWGPRISAIPIASREGLLDVGIYRGNVNSDVFLDFVHDHLAPNVNPFNGINPPSIVVMVTIISQKKPVTLRIITEIPTSVPWPITSEE